jgi:valyl-tRNA synthetase
MNTEGKDTGLTSPAMQFSAADRWIISRLHETAGEVETAFHDYRFDLAAQALYSFTWNEYCDWYLELSKVVLNDPGANAESQRGTRHTLVNVLETLLRLLHPLMPFITEELWQRVALLTVHRGETIMRKPYPRSEPGKIDAAASEEMRWVMGVITAVRSIRSNRDITPSRTLPVLLADGTSREHDWMTRNDHYLKLLARAESLTWLSAGATTPESAMELVGTMKVLVPLGAFINKQEELARIQKEIDKTVKEIAKARSKLANADFVARAPAAVVEQEKQRVADFEAALAKLNAQQAQVSALPD